MVSIVCKEWQTVSFQAFWEHYLRKQYSQKYITYNAGKEIAWTHFKVRLSMMGLPIVAESLRDRRK